jgi:hypothetical protein
MKHVNLEVAQCHLRAAHDALVAELHDLPGDNYGIWDAVSLIEDAQSQIRGELRDRFDTRYDWLGGAA